MNYKTLIESLPAGVYRYHPQSLIVIVFGCANRVTCSRNLLPMFLKYAGSGGIGDSLRQGRVEDVRRRSLYVEIWLCKNGMRPRAPINEDGVGV